MSPPSTTLRSYGAVPAAKSDEEAAGVDEFFDAEHAYYLKDTSRLTVRKFLIILCPILGAILIMGGISLFLFKDFSHLYPGRGGDKTQGGYSSGGIEEEVKPSSSGSSGIVPRTSSASSSSTSKHQGETPSTISTSTEMDFDDAGATCAVHPDCSDLDGYCCPTSDGNMLECCN